MALKNHLAERMKTLQMLNDSAFKTIESKRKDIDRMDAEIAGREIEIQEIKEALE